MGAWFKRDIGGGAACRIPGLIERHRLAMRAATMTGLPLACDNDCKNAMGI